MAYQPHTLVTFGGTLSGLTSDDDIWECGIRGFNMPAALGPIAQGELQAFVDEIAEGQHANLTSLHDWWTETTTHGHPYAKLAWVKAVNINAAGSYAGDPAIHEYSSPYAGSGTVSNQPTMTGLCLSWTTGRSFGRAKFGRIYPPNAGGYTPNGNFVGSGPIADYVTSAKNLIDYLTVSASEYQFKPYVVSKSGVSNPITGVRVGNKIDVQRRRKNAGEETYQTSSLP